MQKIEFNPNNKKRMTFRPNNKKKKNKVEEEEVTKVVTAIANKSVQESESNKSSEQNKSIKMDRNVLDYLGKDILIVLSRFLDKKTVISKLARSSRQFREYICKNGKEFWNGWFMGKYGYTMDEACGENVKYDCEKDHCTDVIENVENIEDNVDGEGFGVRLFGYFNSLNVEPVGEIIGNANRVVRTRDGRSRRFRLSSFKLLRLLHAFESYGFLDQEINMNLPHEIDSQMTRKNMLDLSVSENFYPRTTPPYSGMFFLDDWHDDQMKYKIYKTMRKFSNFTKDNPKYAEEMPREVAKVLKKQVSDAVDKLTGEIKEREKKKKTQKENSIYFSVLLKRVGEEEYEKEVDKGEKVDKVEGDKRYFTIVTSKIREKKELTKKDVANTIFSICKTALERPFFKYVDKRKANGEVEVFPEGGERRDDAEITRRLFFRAVNKLRRIFGVSRSSENKKDKKRYTLFVSEFKVIMDKLDELLIQLSAEKNSSSGEKSDQMEVKTKEGDTTQDLTLDELMEEIAEILPIKYVKELSEESEYFARIAEYVYEREKRRQRH